MKKPKIDPNLSTRTRLIIAAEELIAKSGVDNLTLRKVTKHAGTNIASVNYHFGSMEHLIGEIFRRYAPLLTNERIRLLSECREALGRPPILEQVIDAFIRPVFMAEDISRPILFIHLRTKLSREEGNEMLRALFNEYFDETTNLFMRRIKEIVTHLSDHEFYWRFNFFIGAYSYSMSNTERISSLGGGAVHMDDREKILNYLVRHVAAGFRAPGIDDGCRRGEANTS